MKRYCYWIRYAMIVVFLTNTATAWASFRGFKFGTPFDDIVRVEKAKFIETAATTVFYQDKLLGLDALVAFHFSPENDQLVAGSYAFNTVGYDINEIIDHYAEVVEVMNRKYGPTLSNGVQWWTQEAKQGNDVVTAFRFAEASFANEWWGPGVQVSLSLKNELNTRGEIVYRIVYKPGRVYDRAKDLSKF